MSKAHEVAMGGCALGGCGLIVIYFTAIIALIGTVIWAIINFGPGLVEALKAAAGA